MKMMLSVGEVLLCFSAIGVAVYTKKEKVETEMQEKKRWG